MAATDGLGSGSGAGAVPGLFLLLLWVGLASWSLGPVLAATLTHGGWTRPNYQGQLVPAAAGLVFIFPAAAGVGVALSLGWIESRMSLAWITASLGMALVGLLDDAAGDHQDRGWHGHLRAWRQEGRLSTGLLKAIAGGLLGLWIAALWPLPAGYWGQRLSLAVMLALSTNAFNLLDLRPGRAVKAFLAVGGVPAAVGLVSLLIPICRGWGEGASAARAMVGGPVASDGGSGGGPFSWWQMSSVWAQTAAAAAVAGFAPRDWRARLMMGDTGANVLGLWAGWAWATLLPPIAWWGVGGVLLAFQWFCERHSLSAWIERHPFWRRLDQWGRQ